jgi:predicted metal-dependent HD superfamily phosphohydrolase
VRGYHDLRHLAEVLSRLDDLGVGDDLEVVLAAWFHDAVYDGAPGAEERSAVLAATELEGLDVDIDEVVRLVRLTEGHDPQAGDDRGEALCDADLAILAAPPERYAEYAAGVRREYAEYSDAEFRAGRLSVLRDLAARERVFRTNYAREHWEPDARANLAAEIGALEG